MVDSPAASSAMPASPDPAAPSGSASASRAAAPSTPAGSSADETAPARHPVVVIAAMPEEAAPLVARLDDPCELPMPLHGTERPTAAVAGTLAGRAIVVLTCGIGVAASAAATAWAIGALAPRAVVSTGSAGGLAADLEVGSVVIGREFAYSIADATAFGYEHGQVPGQPVRFVADESLASIAREAVDVALSRAREADPDAVTAPEVRAGLMLSGDAFVTAPIAEPMRERFPGALTADMETTAIAQTCASAGTPFVAVRCISDLCGPRADQQFHLELDLVAERAAACTEALVVRID